MKTRNNGRMIASLSSKIEDTANAPIVSWCTTFGTIRLASCLLEALRLYRINRENGESIDNPKAPFPSAGFDELDISYSNWLDLIKWPDICGRYWWKLTLKDGQVINNFYWMKDKTRGWPDKSARYWLSLHHAPSGTKIEGFSMRRVYDKRDPNEYKYSIRFTDTYCPAIAKWMQEKDQNYLERLERERLEREKLIVSLYEQLNASLDFFAHLEIDDSYTDNSINLTSSSWAMGENIDRCLKSLLGDKAHIIHPDFATDSPTSRSKHERESGAIAYAKAIAGYSTDVTISPTTGFIYNDGGTLKYPIVMLFNTHAKAGKSSGGSGSHWQLCVVLPEGYQPFIADFPKVTKTTIYFIDSLYPTRSLPYEMEQLFLKGGVHTFFAEEKKYQHIIPAAFPDAAIVNRNPQQQQGSDDCGWWCVYNAFMLLCTGNDAYLEKFNRRSRLFALQLRQLWDLSTPLLEPETALKISAPIDPASSLPAAHKSKLSLASDTPEAMDLRNRLRGTFIPAQSDEEKIDDKEVSELSSLGETEEISKPIAELDNHLKALEEIQKNITDDGNDMGSQQAWVEALTGKIDEEITKKIIDEKTQLERLTQIEVELKKSQDDLIKRFENGIVFSEEEREEFRKLKEEQFALKKSVEEISNSIEPLRRQKQEAAALEQLLTDQRMAQFYHNICLQLRQFFTAVAAINSGLIALQQEHSYLSQAKQGIGIIKDITEALLKITPFGEKVSGTFQLISSGIKVVKEGLKMAATGLDYAQKAIGGTEKGIKLVDKGVKELEKRDILPEALIAYWDTMMETLGLQDIQISGIGEFIISNSTQDRFVARLAWLLSLRYQELIQAYFTEEDMEGLKKLACCATYRICASLLLGAPKEEEDFMKQCLYAVTMFESKALFGQKESVIAETKEGMQLTEKDFFYRSGIRRYLDENNCLLYNDTKHPSSIGYRLCLPEFADEVTVVKWACIGSQCDKLMQKEMHDLITIFSTPLNEAEQQLPSLQLILQETEIQKFKDEMQAQLKQMEKVIELQEQKLQAQEQKLLAQEQKLQPQEQKLQSPKNTIQEPEIEKNREIQELRDEIAALKKRLKNYLLPTESSTKKSVFFNEPR